MAFPVSVLLGVWMAAPATHVAVQHDGPRGVELQAQLAERILDAGYALAPGAEGADARVVVSESDDVAQVLVSHEGLERRHHVRQSVPQLRALEIAHRTVGALEDLAPPGGPSRSHGTRIALDVSGGVPGRGELAVLLLDDAFVVVAADAPASWRICVRGTDGSYRVSRSRAVGCAGASDGPPAATVAELHERVREQARAIRSGAARSSMKAELDDAARTDVASLRRTAVVDRRRQVVVRMGAEAGALTRPIWVDGMAAIRLDIGRRSGVAAAFRTTFVPSGGPSYLALDTFLATGPEFRIVAGGRVDLGLGVLGGLLAHRFSREGEAVSTSVDPNLEFPVRIGIDLRSGIGLDIGVLQGYSVRSREYRANGSRLWKRGSYRAGLSLAIRYERKVG